jgi:hypothetical protein
LFSPLSTQTSQRLLVVVLGPMGRSIYYLLFLFIYFGALVQTSGMFFFLSFITATLSRFYTVPPNNFLKAQTFNFATAPLPSTPGLKHRYNVTMPAGKVLLYYFLSLFFSLPQCYFVFILIFYQMQRVLLISRLEQMLLGQLSNPLLNWEM